jgi:molecular chaperone GrpE
LTKKKSILIVQRNQNKDNFYLGGILVSEDDNMTEKTDETTDEEQETAQAETPDQAESTKSQEVVDDQESETSEGENDLETQLANSQAELEKSNEKLLRLAAEFENYKKRMGRDKAQALKFAEESLIKEILPSVDNLDRALEQAKNTEDIKVFIEGIELTQKGMLSSLEKVGVKPIKSVGEKFDPNFHEAMVMEASEDVEENHIIQDFEKGYLYKERLIRAAKVIVSKGKK